MSEYQEFTGKSVEEAIRQACETFGVGLGDLDFEILTPGSRGVLGMGAEPARIVAAPRTATGGAPRREAAQGGPLPEAPRSGGPAGRGDRDSDRARGDRDHAPRREDRSRGGPPRGDRDRGPRREEPVQGAPAGGEDRAPRTDRPPREDRGPRRGDRDRGPRRDDRASQGTRGPAPLSPAEMEQVTSARGSVAMERAELEAAEATPETLAQGRGILETLMGHLGFTGIRVDVREGETSRLNVVAEGSDRESLGSLIGRKGERLSALQHVVNLMLSRKTGQWTRVLVDVEDYRGRRERQLQDIAQRAAERVGETGKMIQLEPMPALERRWVHLTLRAHPDVATQSIGEEPNRRIVVLPRNP
jgi:spoIIIJ-associated protein